MELVNDNLIAAIVTVFMAIVAAWQAYEARKATRTTDAVISALTPSDDSVTEAPAVLPGRSWKMSEQTKRWLTFDHPADEQKMLLDQVAAAELIRQLDYQIKFPGGWYDISSGLIAGSGRGL